MVLDDLVIRNVLAKFLIELSINSNVCFAILLQTRTKDGYLLGLQRVSSSSVIVQERSSPVLLVHGLFMVIFFVTWFGYLIWSWNVNKCRLYVVKAAAVEN